MRDDRDAGQPGKNSALTRRSHRMPAQAGPPDNNRRAGITADGPIVPEATTPLRAPVFTLGSALRWLGHDCPDGRCFCAPIDTLRASVWFLRHGPQCRPFPAETRVLIDAIDIGDTVTAIRRMIYQVNGCTHRDAIEVRYQPRCADDRPERLVPQRAPVAPLDRYQPTELDELSGSSEDDLRALTWSTRW